MYSLVLFSRCDIPGLPSGGLLFLPAFDSGCSRMCSFLFWEFAYCHSPHFFIGPQLGHSGSNSYNRSCPIRRPSGFPAGGRLGIISSISPLPNNSTIAFPSESYLFFRAYLLIRRAEVFGPLPPHTPTCSITVRFASSPHRPQIMDPCNQIVLHKPHPHFQIPTPFVLFTCGPFAFYPTRTLLG